jgi:hypothetical protein
MNTDILILNIQDRFRAMEHAFSIDDKSFTTACIEYSYLLGSSEDIGKVIKRLALHGEIDKEIFQLLFNYSTIRLYYKNSNQQFDNKTLINKIINLGNFSLPKFYDKEVEDKLGLLNNFLNLLNSEDKRSKQAIKNKTGNN